MPTISSPSDNSGLQELLGKPVGVRLEGVSRIHRMGDVAVPAVREVDLEIAPGEFVALMGPSGSGKSTLLSLIGGLDRATSGRVLAGGTDLGKLSDRRLADYRLQRVGTIFQSFNLVPTLTARENVALPMALAGASRGARALRADRLLDLVGLGDRKTFRPTRLSGGEQQRVSVARALANRPGVLLADEPTGNLDTAAGARVLDLIEELNGAGATVVMVTHDPEVAARAKRVVRLRDGRVVEDSAAGAKRRQPEEPAPERPGRLAAFEALRMGVSAVRRRKLRTGLSSGGVAIGIVAMALIMSLATGIQGSLLTAFAQAGNLQQVQVAYSGIPGQTDRKALDQGAVDSLRKLPHVTDAWGQVVLEGEAVIDGTSAGGLLAQSDSPIAHQPSFASKFLLKGRLPGSDSAAEAVVNQPLLSKFHISPKDAVGKQLDYRAIYSGFVQPGSGVPPASDRLDLKLTIVGVATGGGLALPGLLLPYAVATRYWSDMARANNWLAEEFQSISLEVDSAANTDRVAAAVKKLGYPAQSGQDAVKQIQQVFLFLGLALSAFGAIALVVACLGIANTMYTAVLERTREIGILKAIGARSSDVLGMFVSEAATVGALGGVIGIVVTAGAALVGNLIVDQIARNNGFGLDLQVFQIPWWLVVTAIGLAALFSALAGLLPAIRASRLNPVIALRYE